MAYNLRKLTEKPTKAETIMNAKIEKTINGVSVSANPIFKDGVLPAYWSCAVNEHILPKTFSSASEVFRFAKKLTLVSQRRTPQ